MKEYTLEELRKVIETNKDELPITYCYIEKMNKSNKIPKAFSISNYHQTEEYTFRVFYCKTF